MSYIYICVSKTRLWGPMSAESGRYYTNKNTSNTVPLVQPNILRVHFRPKFPDTGVAKAATPSYATKIFCSFQGTIL